MHHLQRSLALLAFTLAAPAAAREWIVHPGQSIQAAVDRARPGDRVVILPGVYRETGRPCPARPDKLCAVSITRDDIRIIGHPAPGHPVVLENAGGQDTGIFFARENAVGAQCLSDPRQRITGAQVEGLTVNGFDGNGIYLFCVDDWLVARNAAHDNEGYGIYPSHCGPGRMTHNVATGSNDTGLYVGQSHDVRVDDNIASDNVSGFEVESCVRVRLDHNAAFHNTAGAVIFIEPGVDVLVSRDNRIDHNVMHDNNRPNTCEPGDDVCLVPPGVGILVISGEHNVIEHNALFGNDTVGIALTDACSAFQVDPSICAAALGFDPDPRSTRIVLNVALDNGTAPRPPPGADLLWTGTGTDNCWEHNLARVLVPPELPRCH